MNILKQSKKARNRTPGSWIPGLMVNYILLNHNVAPFKLIIRALFEIDLVVDAPGQGLLMQGDISNVFDRHPPGLFNHRIAFRC